MKKKIKQHWKIVIFILLIVVIIGAFLFGFYPKKRVTSDYWNTFWTAISSIAIPLSALTFYYQISEDKKNYQKEEGERKDRADKEQHKLIKEEKDRKNQELKEQYELALEKEKETKERIYIDCITKINKIVFRISSENSKEMSNEDKEEETNKTNVFAQDHYVSDLKMLTDALLTLKTIPNIDLELANSNGSDVIDAALLIYSLAKHNDYWGKIKSEITLLSSLMEQIESLSDNSDTSSDVIEAEIQHTSTGLLTIIEKIKNLYYEDDNTNLDNKIVIVRTQSNDVLGNWKMSKNRAKDINFIIGVSGKQYESKKLVAVYKVSDFESTVEDRIKFIGEKLDIIIDKNITPLENWNSRNPVLYYSEKNIKNLKVKSRRSKAYTTDPNYLPSSWYTINTTELKRYEEIKFTIDDTATFTIPTIELEHIIKDKEIQLSPGDRINIEIGKDRLDNTYYLNRIASYKPGKIIKLSPEPIQ